MISQATTNPSDCKPIRWLVLLGTVQADVRVAQGVEAVAQVRNDEVLAVAVRAQVAEDDMVELWVGDVAEEIGYLVV